jgi:hypothetical protein
VTRSARAADEEVTTPLPLLDLVVGQAHEALALAVGERTTEDAQA